MTINKSQLMKRAWAAYQKNEMTFAEALTWSWKISKKEASDKYSFRTWKPAGNGRMLRRYFSDNSYIQYKFYADSYCFEVQKISGGIAAEANETQPERFATAA